ncbi:MAG: DUF4493 domain-containing protein [Bacteroidaceae bacterium]|nr:DUF4493 domain-containing protein [Bacteroidaceae bacterium]
MNYKQFSYAVGAYAFAVCALMSCSQSGDDELTAAAVEKGKFKISLQAANNFSSSSRAVNEADYKSLANYRVVITDQYDAVKEEFAGNAVPSSINLPIGSYKVTASYGEEQAASRDKFLSTGYALVNITGGDEQVVSITCEPTCGKVAVNFDATMATYYTDYYVEYSTPKLGTQKAMWAKGDKDPYYLAVNAGGDEITATVHLTPKEEYMTDEQKTASFVDGVITQKYTLKRNEAWTMKIKPNYTNTTGTLGISITIDETTVDHPVDITVPAEWIIK